MTSRTRIEELANMLKLTYIRDNAESMIQQTRHSGRDCGELLESLLQSELERRTENGITRRITAAGFPVRKYLVDFDRSKYDTAFMPKFRELESLRFIQNFKNIILIGTPGAAKTHYATALGIEACMRGKSVLFVSVPNLIVELKEAVSQSHLNSYRKKFEKYNLVILDELGYVSFDKSGCELLFHLLSNRHGKGSVIITTNLTFEHWENVFKDPVLTGAMIDRLAHKAHILDISREQGGRFEETLTWLRSQGSQLNSQG